MLDDRFWAKVDKADPSGCWVWLANRNNKGYGLFRPGGTAPKALTHRLSFAEVYGPIPLGRLVLHSCDNPACVNPAHLRLGDHKANVADMDQRARRVSSARKGGANPSSAASDTEVTFVRWHYVSGYPFPDIARASGLSLPTVREYCVGKSFAHLYGTDRHPTKDAMKAESARRMRSGAKITKAIADQIRARLESGETGQALAVEFGIHKATVSDIKLGKIWP